MPDLVGRAVDFQADGAIRLGVVTGEGKSKLLVTDQNGRQHSVAPRNVLVRHSEGLDSTRPAAEAGRILQRIDGYQAAVDTELIWDSVAGDAAAEFTAEQLAELYFGTPDSCQVSAVLRAAAADSLRFRVRGASVTPRSPEQVELQLLADRRTREKEELRSRTRSWLSGILEGNPDASGLGEAEKQNVIRRLEDLLTGRQKDEEASGWLGDLEPESTPRMTAYQVLAAVGRLPASADPLLVATGIDPQFSREALEHAGKLELYQGAPGRSGCGAPLALAIDDEETREIDDAFSLVKDERGWTLFVYVSDLVHFIARDDLLDREAQRRISTVYMPQTTVRMLPEKVSCDLASLRPGQLRPVLVLQARFSPDFELLDWSFDRGEISVSRHLSYDEADQMIRDGATDDPAASMLLHLVVLTGLLTERRIRDGAIVFHRPEVKIIARNDSVQLKVLDTGSPSRKLVSELMILMNGLAAQLARDAGIPFIYRSQPPPSQPVQVPTEYDPVRVNELFASLEKSRLSSEPQPHSGLGLPAYTQLTSPIRRFGDLVLQRQLSAHCQGEQLPYSQEDLAGVLGMIQSLDGDLRAAERNANRFYTLSYLAANWKDRAVAAVVLRRLERGGLLVETGEFFVRGLLPVNEEIVPGTRLNLYIEQIHPYRNILTFRLAS